MSSKKPRVLIVDDDVEMAEMVADHLSTRGYASECAAGGNAALAALRRRSFDAVITDLRMDDVDGFDVLRASLEDDPARPVLIMTAYGTIDSAIEALQRGAAHYLTKPFKLSEACLFLERALAERGMRRENDQLRRIVDERFGFEGLIGKSPPMQQVYDLLQRVAPVLAPVLILGESGTGKELVARAIHFGGPRGKAPFVAVNCAALPEQLLESELFGHARGAFTGATETKKGLFVEADGGTLFLDEIGELPLPLQAKLLRALESSAVRPVGGAAERKVDVRIVAATNCDLVTAVQERRFREDLYYRLHVIPIRLPPLRDRREDIPLLVEHFLRRHAERHPGAPARHIGPEVMKWLIEQPWPGNVRELENTIERLVLLARGPNIDLLEISQKEPEATADPLAQFQSEIVPLRVVQRRYVEWVLAQTDGNKVRAAQLLGIDASTIYRMLARGD
jgi:two-component system response regulator HydG